ncbi:MAG TPA: amidohydrolase family protein [Gemmatimonadota bacterium]|nr:amidohydrolase family protein [Gemmatimonadota bacterium]
MAPRFLQILLLLPPLLVFGRALAVAQTERPTPLVDHHQHLMSARAIGPAPAAIPNIELPPPLDRVLDARNRVIETGDPGDLYVEDARILDVENALWTRGADAIAGIATTYTPDTRFFPNGYALGDSTAFVTGMIRSGANDFSTDDLSFVLGLVEVVPGEWRIAVESATIVPPRPFSEPITADILIGDLDAVGIERAVVLSVAYWFSSPGDEWPGDEVENVRAENDWVAEQVARYPDRLTAFCSVSPIRPYAVDEIRRCAEELGVPGLKLHLANSRVNLHDSAHVTQLRRVFEIANELGLAIVVHSRTHRSFGPYGREEAQVLLERIFPAAPDIPIQIAHLWGGADVSEDALGVFADAVSSGDPRARNLSFDLTEMDRAIGDSEETWARITERIRQIGLERIFYGSDMRHHPLGPPSTLGWSRLVRALPLTDAELADIADNVAPYLRSPQDQ